MEMCLCSTLHNGMVTPSRYITNIHAYYIEFTLNATQFHIDFGFKICRTFVTMCCQLIGINIKK